MRTHNHGATYCCWAPQLGLHSGFGGVLGNECCVLWKLRIVGCCGSRPMGLRRYRAPPNRNAEPRNQKTKTAPARQKKARKVKIEPNRSHDLARNSRDLARTAAICRSHPKSYPQVSGHDSVFSNQVRTEIRQRNYTATAAKCCKSPERMPTQPRSEAK